jgi:PAS domain S-box-containing protein
MPLLRHQAVEPGSARGLRPLIAALGAYALLGGLLTLVGWYARIPRLTDWGGVGIAMFANTAAAAACAGASLLMLARGGPWRAGAFVLGVLVALLGGAMLTQHLAGVNLRIDTLLVTPTWGERAAAAPGRTGPPASFCFTLLGLAVALGAAPGRAKRIVPALGLTVAAVSTLALTGYLFGATPLFTAARYTGIAAQSASILLALGVGIVAAVPDRQPVRALLERSSAGMLARRALPLIVLAPLGLGSLRLWGEREGLYDTGMGIALYALALIGVLCFLLAWAVSVVGARERALTDSRARLRLAMAAGRTGSWEWFVDTGEVAWSPSLEEIHGLAPGAFGRTLADARRDIHPDDERRVLRAVVDSLDGGGEHRLEYRIILPDGRIRWVEERGQLIRESPGSPRRMTGVTSDITERKKAEQLLAEQARLIEATNDAIFVVDTDLRITAWSDGAERTYGFAAAEVLGRNAPEVLGSSMAAEDRAAWVRGAAGGRIRRIETMLRRKDGAPVWIDAALAPRRDERGVVVGYISIGRDITARKRSEQSTESRAPVLMVAELKPHGAAAAAGPRE